MRIQDVREFLLGRQTNEKNEATHVWLSPQAAGLLVGTGRDDQEQFCQFIYEAHRLKDPQAIRELLTPVFALHFVIELKGTFDSMLLKKVAGTVGKALSEFYPKLQSYKGVIFHAKMQDTYRCQVIFPHILVDAGRHRQIRASLIETISNASGTMPFMNELRQLHGSNQIRLMLQECDSRVGVDVPLCACTRSPLNIPEAPLTPLACAMINQDAVSPLSEPEQRWRWVQLGLKRRPGGNLTEWSTPREFRRQGASEGSSGRGSCRGGTSSGTDESGFA